MDRHTVRHALLGLMLAGSLFFGCTAGQKPGSAQEEQPAEQGKTISIVFCNDVEEADVWVLEATEKNLKSSLWGTAMADDLAKGGECALTVNASHGTGEYIIRMIDCDDVFYESGILELEEGYTLRIYSEDNTLQAVKIDVYDARGEIVLTGDVFAAAL